MNSSLVYPKRLLSGMTASPVKPVTFRYTVTPCQQRGWFTVAVLSPYAMSWQQQGRPTKHEIQHRMRKARAEARYAQGDVSPLLSARADRVASWIIQRGNAARRLGRTSRFQERYYEICELARRRYPLAAETVPSWARPVCPD